MSRPQQRNPLEDGFLLPKFYSLNSHPQKDRRWKALSHPLLGGK